MRARRGTLATALVMGIVGSLLVAPGAKAVTIEFEDTGPLTKFTVPAGVTSISFYVEGAAGRPGGGGAAGGFGGVVTGDLAVTPGQDIWIRVGGLDAGGVGYNAFDAATGSVGGNGGGSSDIRTIFADLNSRVVVGAGGGGGGGHAHDQGPTTAGGPGGSAGAGGTDGTDSSDITGGGGGGAGGAGAGGTAGSAGELFASPGDVGLFRDGGNGGARGFSGGGSGGGGGGGGDGWYGGGGGGGGGSACCPDRIAGAGGGGGGSNRVGPGVSNSSQFTDGSGGDGFVQISYPDPEIDVSPGNKAFGDAVVGGASATQTFTVSNGGTPGNAPDVTVDAVELSGTNPGQFEITSDGCTGQTLSDGESCPVQARFAPTTAGNKEADLVVTPEGFFPDFVTLTGTGKNAPVFQGTPGSHAFGSLNVGQTSQQSFEVANANGMLGQPLDMDVSSVGIVGGGGAFGIDSEDCTDAPLAPGGSCDVAVSFSPTSGGAQNAVLRVNSDAPGSPHDIALSGTGVAPGGGGDDDGDGLGLGKFQKNAKKGTGFLFVTVPGPGELSLTGKGVAAIAGARAAQQVGGAGQVKLKVRAVGKAAKKLRRKGKVQLTVTVTFTPSGGGAALSETTKLTLRKKAKKKK